jgi:hypothetical protein
MGKEDLMDIPIQDAKVGLFLIKGGYVREIVRDYGERVQYRTYVLATGKPEPVLEACRKRHLIHWAERLCTLEELRRLKVEDARALEQNSDSFHLRVLLNTIPDTELVQEVRRRGLSLDDP